MIYVCSDIHGNYDRYEKAKSLLKPNGEDVLFILGDMIDRGPDGIKILMDVMNQDYIVAMAGNHEWMMYQSLVLRKKEEYDNWVYFGNGGDITMEAFARLSKEDQMKLLRFISHLPIAMQLEVNNKKIYLTHGCARRECMDETLMDLSECDYSDAFQIVWDSPMTDYSLIPEYREYGNSDLYIHGHKFVQRQQKNYQAIAYKEENFEILFIDGGCAIREPERYGFETALIVYCIDTDEAIYITD